MSCCNRCRPIKIMNDGCCGVCVTSTCSTHCTRLCCKVTYTVTITNNCTNAIKCVNLHVPLDGVFCLDPSTVTVNGEAVQVDCLDSVPVGDIEPGATATVVYSATVMEYKRYVRTRALVTFYVCCCCERRDMGVYSNTNLLQVCPCCCCCSNQTTD